MGNNFIEEMNFDEIKRLDKPFAVLIFGLPGSGKTHVSQLLAKELEIYFLRSEYLRLYYYKILEDRFAAKRGVDSTNRERFVINIANRISFVFDGNERDRDSYKDLILLARKYGFDLITIAIESKDEDNISRLRNRTYNPYYIDFNIVGDSGLYGIKYDETGYQKRKAHCFSVKEKTIDFVIDNTGTVDSLNEQIIDIANKIKQRNMAK